MADYKTTLLLPQTEFPMKADLARREPEFLAQWQADGIYQKMLAARKDNPPFILHDGPPYANGNIHIGHIMNKVLKDIVVKYRSMSGHYTPITPGWDCHGLPIELQVEKNLDGKKKDMSRAEIRVLCREYASQVIAAQRDQFKRLGVFADWDNPYLTMAPAYQAQIAREFANCLEKGMVYRGRKPIYWCASCATALAEAEVEYADHTSPSIYVKFAFNNVAAMQTEFQLPNLPIYSVIWTTTPWTLPANLGIAMDPDIVYVALQVGSEIWIVARDLIPAMKTEIGFTNEKILKEISATELERKTCRHPFIERDSLIVLGDHVTLEAGTGCVHTAPGHGQDDYIVGQRYDLEVLAPLDNRGCFTAESGCDWLQGLSTKKANPVVIEKLQAVGVLVHQATVNHSYPHCWRCKSPVIFRATDQWFLSMEKNNFRASVLAEIDRVQWIPTWGRERIHGMLKNRPDWCLSRQRTWGVPIVAVHCKECDQTQTTPDLVRYVADQFETRGADCWYTDDLKQLLPAAYACPTCHTADHFEKEWNILDVWFDSGVSYAAVIEKQGLQLPVDLYLEGSDQHRGWFHTSLLTCMATRNHAPYKAVLTHGFVVDADGKKYSKSAKNYVPPEQVIAQNGAEILRLWVSAEDYRNDIRVSTEILNRLIEGYRKIRNTMRFLLGNLSDFSVDRDSMNYEDLQPLDQYALHTLHELVAKCQAAYQSYEFHTVYHSFNQFCIVDLSTFYLDIVKDRLYCENATGPLRRSAQTAMWHILDTMTRLLAPILSFTAEEVWQFSPPYAGKSASIFLADLPTPDQLMRFANYPLAERWERLRTFRSDVAAVLEPARKDKVIGNSLDAQITVTATPDLAQFLQSFGAELPDLLLVSEFILGDAAGTYMGNMASNPDIRIAAVKTEREKCERCWRRAPGVGQNTAHPTLCTRCVGVVG